MSFFALLDYLQNGLPPVWKPGIISYQEFADDVVKIHNEIRRKHKGYALRLNDELCTMTQQWADKLSFAQDLAHSGNKYKGIRVGENIAMKWTSNKAVYRPDEVCDQWYNELKNFQFGVEPTAPIVTAGHFTQMVWRNSTEIGVGRSQAKDGRSIVVISYFPPGNVMAISAGRVCGSVMSWTQPPSQHTARGWVHNAENRKNFQRYFALVEAEKIDPDMEPYISPPPLRPDFRKGHYGFVEGYEHRTVRWYTYRDASGSNKVVQTTVTNPSHPPVTRTEYFKECHGALGSYV